MSTALKIALPEAERGVSPETLQRFDKAKRALDNPMTKARARDAHARTLAHIENAPREARDADWLERSTRETIALAQARGEDVETARDGRVNVTSRDSLLNMIKAGKLTPDQAKAGRDCRDAYEIRSQSLGAMNYSDTGRGGRDHEASIAWGIAKANASLMLPFVERFIQLRHHAEPMALTMFRAILSERHTIADHGTSQSVRERNTAAFILALDAAVDGLEAWERVRAGR